jgi:hypothetical protein
MTNIATLREYFKTHRLFTKASPKTIKGEKYGYKTLILYMKPWKSGGHGNLCPMAGSCKKTCLNTSGHGRFASTQEARQRRTDLFFLDRDFFIAQARWEIENHRHYCATHNMKPVVRFNGTSDFPFENLGIMQQFPDVIFYDYTKVWKRLNHHLTVAQAAAWPKNYTLVFSLDEKPDSWQHANDYLAIGGKVAVVFGPSKVGHMPQTFELPQYYSDIPVVDGDRSDLVFLNPPGTILGLRAKGQAKHDVSGFVIRHA